MVEKNWCLEKLAELIRSDKSRRDRYLEDIEFFNVENKNPKSVHIYSAYKKLKDRGLKFLTTNRNSPIKRYTVQLGNKLKFLTRFLYNANEAFMDEYAKKCDRKNIIFVRDPNRKSGYIPFKLALTKEYIKQFLLNFSAPDFNKFIHESIKDKIKSDPTLGVIGTRVKYLKVQNYVARFKYHENIYKVNNTQTLSIFTKSDLYLRANKSFARDLIEIGHS